MIRLARAGYDVEGIDINEAAVGHCNARLRRNGFRPTARIGDIAELSVGRRFDAVICMLNGFRHLLTEEAAQSHLESVARALVPGGLYILGVELTPNRGRAGRDSLAMATRGRLTIVSRIGRRAMDRARRLETRTIVLDVYTPSTWRRLTDTMTLRTYSYDQLMDLIAHAPGLELVRTMDMDRATGDPPPVHPTTERAVFVMRRS
jgi:2-polyprenyl-3-methyl-5-hydroxy-6-metoxy-1,4-benzoquinol methylase